jgi:3-oxoacyl-[acyl-carrier protein] reductase
MNAIVADLQSKYAENKLRISIHQVDVGSADQIEAMFQRIDKEHGHRPDILVSNAGYGKRVPNVWDIELEEFDYTLSVNLRASFILTKGVVEHMKSQRWGRIIFMSSIAAQGGGINGCREFTPLFCTYCILTEYARLRRFQGWPNWNDEEPVDPPSRV